GLQYTTPKPAAACNWKSSTKRLPYWVNGPPCTFSSTGYRCPGAAANGAMAQQSTSVPSADWAVNRCGRARLTDSPNGRVKLVSARSTGSAAGWLATVAGSPAGRSLAASSPVDTGEPATKASVPPAQAHSLIHRSPPASSAGGPAPP